ncbi:MAG: glycosyltransferase [bacterium]|nr:glycosyltransferase [bacterium]
MSVVSIILVNYNQEQLTIKSLESIRRFLDAKETELMVLDNASRSWEKLQAYCDSQRVLFFRNEKNLGYAAAVNRCIRQASGEYIFLLNNDAFFIEPFTFRKVLEEMRGDTGMAGFHILNEDRSTQYSIYRFPSLFYYLMDMIRLSRVFPIFSDLIRNRKRYTVTGRYRDMYLKGVAMLFHKKTVEDAGLFDEKIFLYGEETDLQFRLVKQGRAILYYPDIRVVHLGSMGTGDNFLKLGYIQKSLLYYFNKHYGRFSRNVLRAFMMFETGLKSLLFLLFNKEKSSGYLNLFRSLRKNGRSSL